MYDPSFVGRFGQLRQQEMLADAERRRLARWKAKLARASQREQRAERRLRWAGRRAAEFGGWCLMGMRALKHGPS